MTNSHTITLIANTTAGVTATSGVLQFLNENAGALGVIMTFIMACVSTFFYIKSHSLKKKELKRSIIEAHSNEITSKVINELRKNMRKGDQVPLIISPVKYDPINHNLKK